MNECGVCLLGWFSMVEAEGDKMKPPGGGDDSTDIAALFDSDRADNGFRVQIQPPPGSCSNGACAGPILYKPLHPALFGKAFQAAWLAPRFVSAVQDGSEAAIRAMLHEEVPGRVFSFEMLQPSFCKALLEELINYEESGLPVVRPNTMNNYVSSRLGTWPLGARHAGRSLWRVSWTCGCDAAERLPRQMLLRSVLPHIHCLHTWRLPKYAL